MKKDLVRKDSVIEEIGVFEQVMTPSSNITKVFSEKKYIFNAPHRYQVYPKDIKNLKKLGEIKFQEGLVKELGQNGVTNEDLIVMVIDRLAAFQKSEFSCKENGAAIQALGAALWILQIRTDSRIKRGVEGANKV